MYHIKLAQGHNPINGSYCCSHGALGTLGKWLLAKKKLRALFSSPNTSMINSKFLSKVHKVFEIGSLFTSGTSFLNHSWPPHSHVLSEFLPSWTACCFLYPLLTSSKLLPLLGGIIISFLALCPTKRRSCAMCNSFRNLTLRNLSELFGPSKWILSLSLVT